MYRRLIWTTGRGNAFSIIRNLCSHKGFWVRHSKTIDSTTAALPETLAQPGRWLRWPQRRGRVAWPARLQCNWLVRPLLQDFGLTPPLWLPSRGRRQALSEEKEPKNQPPVWRDDEIYLSRRLEYSHVSSWRRCRQLCQLIHSRTQGIQLERITKAAPKMNWWINWINYLKNTN